MVSCHSTAGTARHCNNPFVPFRRLWPSGNPHAQATSSTASLALIARSESRQRQPTGIGPRLALSDGDTGCTSPADAGRTKPGRGGDKLVRGHWPFSAADSAATDGAQRLLRDRGARSSSANATFCLVVSHTGSPSATAKAAADSCRPGVAALLQLLSKPPKRAELSMFEDRIPCANSPIPKSSGPPSRAANTEVLDGERSIGKAIRIVELERKGPADLPRRSTAAGCGLGRGLCERGVIERGVIERGVLVCRTGVGILSCQLRNQSQRNRLNCFPMHATRAQACRCAGMQACSRLEHMVLTRAIERGGGARTGWGVARLAPKPQKPQLWRPSHHGSAWERVFAHHARRADCSAEYLPSLAGRWQSVRRFCRSPSSTRRRGHGSEST